MKFSKLNIVFNILHINCLLGFCKMTFTIYFIFTSLACIIFIPLFTSFCSFHMLCPYLSWKIFCQTPNSMSTHQQFNLSVIWYENWFPNHLAHTHRNSMPIFWIFFGQTLFLHQNFFDPRFFSTKMQIPIIILLPSLWLTTLPRPCQSTCIFRAPM